MFNINLFHALAGGLADFVQWVEAGIDHLHEVLSCKFARRVHLSKGERERLHLLTIAHGNITGKVKYVIKTLHIIDFIFNIAGNS